MEFLNVVQLGFRVAESIGKAGAVQGPGARTLSHNSIVR